MLPGASIDLDPGHRLGTVEHHQKVTRDVVADLARRDVPALLLYRQIRHGQQHVFTGFKANPVEVKVPNIATKHQAIDHLIRVHETFLGYVIGADDLRRRWLARCPIYGDVGVKPRHIGQDKSGNAQCLLCAEFLRDQAFTCKGNAGSHGGSYRLATSVCWSSLKSTATMRSDTGVMVTKS